MSLAIVCKIVVINNYSKKACNILFLPSFNFQNAPAMSYSANRLRTISLFMLMLLMAVSVYSAIQVRNIPQRPQIKCNANPCCMDEKDPSMKDELLFHVPLTLVLADF